MKPLHLLIIGAGPAGLTAAILAARLGWRVSLVDKEREMLTSNELTADAGIRRFKVGESLPPTARPLLERLGICNDFLAQGHLPAYGVRSYWGTEQEVRRDFISHPLGHAWHLDRPKFEQLLFSHAQRQGVEVKLGLNISRASFAKNEWSVEFSDRNTARYDFIFDATGRNSWFARQQGANRLYEFRQLALVAFGRVSARFNDHSTLIESTQQGWWYSALLPDGLMTWAYFCRPGTEERKRWQNLECWPEVLLGAPQTQKRLSEIEEWVCAPYFVSAASSMLEYKTGPGWCAIGDAAMTLDPVSSHGITLAMVSARDAVTALEREQKGEQAAWGAYENILNATFQRYALERKGIYRQEQRYTDSPYWRTAQA